MSSCRSFKVALIRAVSCVLTYNALGNWRYTFYVTHFALTGVWSRARGSETLFGAATVRERSSNVR